MKTLLTTAALNVLFFSTSLAQFIEDVKLADIKSQYIQVKIEHLIQGDNSVHLDYGQASVGSSSRKTLLRNENGKAMEFNSTMDAINYLTGYGYHLVEAFNTGTESFNTSYYILKKEAQRIQ